MGEIIHEFVDIVSKNGNMLLNVPPKADGTLDGDTRQILVEIGKWMDVNSEAIYGTRPWHTCGADRLRYTRKGDSLYAIILEWPGAGHGLVIPQSALGAGVPTVSGVSLLGYDGELSWSPCDEGLFVTCLPAPCDYACALEVRM